jgi:hypothetical protein
MTALDVKMDGRRFDVGVSDPFLEIFLIMKKLLNLNRKWEIGVLNYLLASPGS